jgi:hypothetical protein
MRFAAGLPKLESIHGSHGKLETNQAGSNAAGLGWGLRVCICNRLQSDTDVSPGTKFCVANWQNELWRKAEITELI